MTAYMGVQHGPKLAHDGGCRCIDCSALVLPDALAWQAYARSKRADDGRLYRRRIDPPIDRPALLDKIIWVELRPGPRYLFRIVGEAVQNRRGGRLMGRYLDETDPDGFEAALLLLYARMTVGQSFCVQGSYVHNQSRLCRLEACVFPIYGDNGPSHILVGMAYGD